MLSEPVLVDTGAIAALFDPRDQHHAVCAAQFEQIPVAKSYTCWPVLTEAVYLARRYPSQRDKSLDGVAVGDFPLLHLSERDVKGIQQILKTYADQQIDLADAALVHLANREGIDVIFTIDRRHFELFRRVNGKPFRLIPDLA